MSIQRKIKRQQTEAQRRAERKRGPMRPPRRRHLLPDLYLGEAEARGRRVLREAAKEAQKAKDAQVRQAHQTASKR